MDESELRYMDKSDSRYSIKRVCMGSVAGALWGAFDARQHLPQIAFNFKAMGRHSLPFAALGGLMVFLDDLMRHRTGIRVLEMLPACFAGASGGAILRGFDSKPARFHAAWFVSGLIVSTNHCREVFTERR